MYSLDSGASSSALPLDTDLQNVLCGGVWWTCGGVGNRGLRTSRSPGGIKIYICERIGNRAQLLSPVRLLYVLSDLAMLMCVRK